MEQYRRMQKFQISQQTRALCDTAIAIYRVNQSLNALLEIRTAAERLHQLRGYAPTVSGIKKSTQHAYRGRALCFDV